MNALEFDLRGICELRGHESDGLEEGYCELDPSSLTTMRHVYGADYQAQAMVDLYERRLVYGRAPNRPRLHAEVLASTLALVRMCRPRSVLDLGCGVGLLTRALVREPYIERVVGADIDARHVKVAQALLPSEPLGHEPQIEMRRLDVTLGADRALVQGIEFIALSEVIQQISDRDWIANVFKLNPDILVVTTPNREFNVNYPDILLCENGLRDPEHAFEFTQSEFIDWARERAGRSNYAVDILPLGPADTAHGPASLMAVFQKHPDTTGKLLVGARQAARSSIIKTATDPHQYDSPEVLWTQEGSATSPNRRLFLEYLRPAIGEMPGKRVLDVGCGLGWLSHEIAQSGGRPLGIDPSMRCLSGARQAFPDLTFQQAALQDFQPETRFDAAFMIMVDNFMDATDVFDGVRRHLHPDGQFIMVTADFEHSLSGHNHRLEYEVINEDAVAIRLENKDRFGVLCDIVHPVHAYLRSAAESGFTLYQHTTIIPRRWHPRYDTHQGKALFHLLEFTKNNPLKGIPGSPN